MDIIQESTEIALAQLINESLSSTHSNETREIMSTIVRRSLEISLTEITHNIFLYSRVRDIAITKFSPYLSSSCNLKFANVSELIKDAVNAAPLFSIHVRECGGVSSLCEEEVRNAYVLSHFGITLRTVVSSSEFSSWCASVHNNYRKEIESVLLAWGLPSDLAYIIVSKYLPRAEQSLVPREWFLTSLPETQWIALHVHVVPTIKKTTRDTYT